MKKCIAAILTLTLVFTLVLSGCAGKAEKAEETVTVTDHLGNTVTVPADIERIAVCDLFPLPSILSIFFDSADKLVAIAPSSMTAAQNGLLSQLYPEILKADTSAISGAEVNTEELMKSDPQVVFYSAGNPQLGETLTNAGFHAVAPSAEKWDYDAVETLNQWLTLLSQLFPEAAGDRAELVREYSEKNLSLVQERTEKLTEAEKKRLFFLFQYSADSIVSAGEKSFGQWWAEAIGAVNVSTEAAGTSSAKVTLEQIYSWDPELILITNFTPSTPQDLYDNTVGSYDWSGVRAAENREVYKMPLGMYRSYTLGVDTPITLLWLSKTVYPELFADIDITAETMDYYKSVFGVELTAEQAESIFAPAGEAGRIDYQGG